MNRNHLFAAGAVTIAGLSILAAWGPLDPPFGPITSTYKTLTEIEPRTPVNAQTAPGDNQTLFRITGPGNYYLTGDITGVPGKCGISIDGSNVTLDLNGFTLKGVNGSVAGIRVNAHAGAAIRNGIARNWSIGFDVFETSGARLSNLTADQNFDAGIKLGHAAVVTDCTVIDTHGSAYETLDNAVLTRCTAHGVGEGRGFEVRDNCILTECSALNMGIGFYLAGPAVLNTCTASDNDSFGFNIQESAILTDCIATNNENSGFVVVARSRLTRCTARNNIEGFYLSEANSLVECTAVSNTDNGVRIIGNSNTVERGTFHENGGSGIYIFDGVGNSIDGNLATYNGFAGILINHSDNLVVRNRARGNPQGNYGFTTGVDYGVILTNPGAGFTSSAAWANFAY